jgi:hypothetical protein
MGDGGEWRESLVLYKLYNSLCPVDFLLPYSNGEKGDILPSTWPYQSHQYMLYILYTRKMHTYAYNHKNLSNNISLFLAQILYSA